MVSLAGPGSLGCSPPRPLRARLYHIYHVWTSLSNSVPEVGRPPYRCTCTARPLVLNAEGAGTRVRFQAAPGDRVLKHCPRVPLDIPQQPLNLNTQQPKLPEPGPRSWTAWCMYMRCVGHFSLSGGTRSCFRSPTRKGQRLRTSPGAGTYGDMCICMSPSTRASTPIYGLR